MARCSVLAKGSISNARHSRTSSRSQRLQVAKGQVVLRPFEQGRELPPVASDQGEKERVCLSFGDGRSVHLVKVLHAPILRDVGLAERLPQGPVWAGRRMGHPGQARQGQGQGARGEPAPTGKSK